ncbi:MAG: hypothetical protein ACRERU_17160 [Methylococcales bacterium]
MPENRTRRLPADETGMRVSGKPHWLHVLATSALTRIGSHTKRGKKAFDAFGILAVFAGTPVALA